MRVTATDHSLAQAIGGDVLLGKAFAFIGAEAFAKPALSWVARLLDGPPRSRVIPLIGAAPVALPGATVEPSPLPSLELASVTSDKALYREGRDVVHLLALDPLAPHATATLELRLHGAPFARHPLTLDAHGAAAITLRELLPGDYEVRFLGAPADSPPCAFTVATYRLAPLVASLQDRRLAGEKLAVSLRVESFGAPVEGEVTLDLTDRGQRLARVKATARAGLVEASFTLSGEGPHAIQVQLAADAGRTATVPIVGSRAAERAETTFSTLGAERVGSLLPAADARPVRGIWLRLGAARATPFVLAEVETAKARLFAACDVETARILVIDPSFPARRPGAVDPETAPHPASVDTRYQRGESLFQAGSFAEARALFEEALAEEEHPHPNYAYYVACCFAREGEKGRAIEALRRAIRDGWKDFALLAKDDDLAALRGQPGYRSLKTRGVREIAVENASAGQVFEIDLPAPMALLAVGAYAEGEPWEGWAATITPVETAPRITVPERATPGEVTRIEIDSGRPDDDVSVYVVVKDARLLAPDTPESRLAGGLKAIAEAASRSLGAGRPARTLADEVPPLLPPSMAYRGGFGGGMDGMMMMPSAGPMASTALPAANVVRREKRAARPAAYESAELALPSPAAPPAQGSAGPYRAPAPPPPPSVEEPEVLFAGLVPTTGGRGGVVVILGPDFADYMVEAFAVAGTAWAASEARFRAEKEAFASLEVPAFAHPDDGALGRLHVGSRSGAAVRVTRDGAPVPLLLDGRALGPDERLPAGRSELSFLAGPGHWEATVEDASGTTSRTARDVEVPGKLRRLARTVRFLSPGDAISRADDAGIRGLRVLPGLDGPFTALVDATADYGHACCEQTAAKMLAACAMFALAGEDRARRERAESIIVAGVRREESMFLRGRGFKMYPDSSDAPNDYWGPLAARHLQNLALVRDLGPGRALTQALDLGLDMAADAMRAYHLAWPPRETATCADAYAALRFGKADGAALQAVRRLLGERDEVGAGGAVATRVELSYAAAALLRGGAAGDLPRALRLADRVLDQLGPEGRLYSTVDSVAAIALAAELSAARVVGGAGRVELDGRAVTSAEAAGAGEIEHVRAVEGVTAVEVTRVIEEDWGRFGALLPVVVKLKKGEAAGRRFEALDAVDLEVSLEAPYEPGDLLWVCLPDALSRVVGGGQVKMFSVDFAGRDRVTVPLAATGITVGQRGQPAPARFAVCVRNMFDEERGGSPGFVEVTVAPPAGGGLLGRVLGGLRGVFGA
jgi:hypothetical protein